MISVEKFKEILDQCKILYDMNGDLAVLLRMDAADSVVDNCVVTILSAIAPTKEAEELIQFFAWECDFGRKENAEIKSAEELYEKIVS